MEDLYLGSAGASALSTDADAAGRWAFRFAPQLGYRSPDQPLFRHSAGDVSPAAQAARAADLGFAGVQYPWAVSRPAAERSQLAKVLRDRGLATGCVVWASWEVIRQPLWGRTDAAAREKIAAHMIRAVAAAKEIGAATIAVLAAADPARPMAEERTGLVDNLHRAADLVQRSGLCIGLEPMIVLPEMMLKTYADGLDVIEASAHPAVRLIFDSGHVQSVGEDPVATLQHTLPHVCLVQLADQPGRVEPGAGTIDMLSVLRSLGRHGYQGLVELEHDWAEDSLEGERRGLARLQALNQAYLAQDGGPLMDAFPSFGAGSGQLARGT